MNEAFFHLLIYINILSCMCSTTQIIVCPFVFFLLVIVLSVLLRYTDSDYPFGIFKIFLEQSNCTDWINFCYITVTDKRYRYPDSCRVMVRNGNSISADIREHTVKKQHLFLLFLDNLAVTLGFLTLQDKYNIHTLTENIKFICTRCETGQKSSPKVRFSKLF